jgi:hypothetical protein
VPNAVAARSEAEALRQFIAPLQRAITAFAEHTFIQRTGFDARASADSLQLTGRTAMELPDAERGARLMLAATVSYRIVRLSGVRPRWTVRTPGYVYELADAEGPGQPIASYHWHPHVPGVPFPHVHLPAAQSPLSRLHLVVPHCTLRHVFAFAMRDYEVRPIRDDWKRAVDEAHVVLDASMEWAQHESFAVAD